MSVKLVSCNASSSALESCAETRKDARKNTASCGGAVRLTEMQNYVLLNKIKIFGPQSWQILYNNGEILNCRWLSD